MHATPRLLTTFANLSLAAAALALQGPVIGHAVAGPQAADDRYIARLADSGWAVEDRDQMIRVAHAECSIKAKGTTDADLREQVQDHYRISADAARTQLAAAEAVYCP